MEPTTESGDASGPASVRVPGAGERHRALLGDVAFIDRDGLALFRGLTHRHVTPRNCSLFVAEQLREIARC